ncbi:hypothetical protein NMY22_g19142 [Coprinellus aureogranulatus]|nr:hypothetical protein NMY22_g19142 [Coprinellus aureogranulatus]
MSSNGIAGDLAHEFFFHVLPHHQASLQHLSFGLYLPFKIWSITEEFLDPILLCRCLKTLHLLFRYPSEIPWVDYSKMTPGNGPFISLHTLLSRITASLPALERLTLKPTPGLHPNSSADDSLRQGYYWLSMKCNFALEIPDVTLDGAKRRASSWFASSSSEESSFLTNASSGATASANYGTLVPAFEVAVAHHPNHHTLFDRESRRFKWTRQFTDEELRSVMPDSEGSDD